MFAIVANVQQIQTCTNSKGGLLYYFDYDCYDDNDDY